jgi:hypothetical protein
VRVVIGRLAEAELKTYAGQFWSLTEQRALHYGAGRFLQAVSLFEQSLRADHKPGRAVLNWLRLALDDERQDRGEKARRWLARATAWLDQYGDGMPDRADQELGLHLQNWLEAHELNRKADTPIRPTDSRNSSRYRRGGHPAVRARAVLLEDHASRDLKAPVDPAIVVGKQRRDHRADVVGLARAAENRHLRR